MSPDSTLISIVITQIEAPPTSDPSPRPRMTVSEPIAQHVANDSLRRGEMANILMHDWPRMKIVSDTMTSALDFAALDG